MKGYVVEASGVGNPEGQQREFAKKISVEKQQPKPSKQGWYIGGLVGWLVGFVSTNRLSRKTGRDFLGNLGFQILISDVSTHQLKLPWICFSSDFSMNWDLMG